MSEHDEPKTALTRLLAGEATKPLAKHAFASESGRGHVWCVCLRWSADRTGSRADDERAYEQHVAAEVAAHLADVLLAEGYTTTPAPETVELRNLRRWKAEALPLFDGLQDLGRALGLPLGTLVTGPAAVEAAEVLRARAEAAPGAASTGARLAAENLSLRATLADVRARHTEARRRLVELGHHPG